eukprot:TRINITY_DN13366_c0_g2_i1.p1 TRINITY_DN13366_c0_g2~~TRINITY_DN13366_c0_g2_i1.p1  ORF type:complete len:377 (+),score=101.83 TRINITY_DN13366_c0_g2_i1:129-1259(+)
MQIAVRLPQGDWECVEVDPEGTVGTLYTSVSRSLDPDAIVDLQRMLLAKQLLLGDELLDDLDMPLCSTALEDGSEVTLVEGKRAAAVNELREMGMQGRFLGRKFLLHTARSGAKTAATMQRHNRVLELLLEAKVEPFSAAITEAAKRCNHHAMSQLIAAGASPTVDCIKAIALCQKPVPGGSYADCLRVTGSSFLAEKSRLLPDFAKIPNSDCCKVILDQGAEYAPILYHAVTNGRSNVVRAAGRSAPAEEMARSVAWAATAVEVAADVILALLDVGADPAAFSLVKLSQLHRDARGDWSPGHWERLLDAGVCSRGALKTAAQHHNVELFKALIPQASKRERDIALRALTASMKSAHSDRVAFIRFLLRDTEQASS